MINFKTMTTNYDLERHQKLLQYKEKLAKQGKFLHKETLDKFVELRTYENCVHFQLIWEARNEYLDMFKNFLLNQITIDQLSHQFHEISIQIHNPNNVLNNNLINEKAKEFAIFIEDLELSFEILDTNPEPYRVPDSIGEYELRKEIERAYVQINDFLKN